MGLMSWLKPRAPGRRPARTEIDAATEGTIEAIVLDQTTAYSTAYWQFFLDVADQSSTEFVKAARRHLGYHPPDADLVVVRSWLLAKTAMRLQAITISELEYLARPRGAGGIPRKRRRRNPPPTEALYEELHGADDTDAAAAMETRMASRMGAGLRDVERSQADRWARLEATVAHPSFEMTAERAAQAARSVQANALVANLEWQRQLLASAPTADQLRDEGVAKHWLADRLAYFIDQIAMISILWDADQGQPLAFYEALCPDAPSLEARRIMGTWVDDHVEPMVDAIWTYVTTAIQQTITYVRKVTRLPKDRESEIVYLVAGAFYFETVNELVRQSGVNVNPTELRLRYLGM